MRTSSGLGQFEIQSPTPAGQKSLLLDSSLAAQGIRDITFAEAGRWVVDEIEVLDLADAGAIRARIDESSRRLEDVTACAVWPVSAHAHMQLIHQLNGLLPEGAGFVDGADMALSAAARWADDEVMKVDLRDPFAIADRIAVAADKLSSTENCRQWPGSAMAHRKVVTDLTLLLHRSRGTVH